MIDLTKLPENILQVIVEMLLVGEGFVIHASERELGRGTIDAIVSPSGSGDKWVMELRRGGNLASLRRVATDLIPLQERYGAARALLITAQVLDENALQQLANQMNGLGGVWDGRQLNALLKKHRRVKGRVERLVAAQDEFVAPAAALPANPMRDTAERLAKTLRELPPGSEDWRKYEKLCIDIFEFVFQPQLRPAREEYRRSEDGLDIRDAVFPMTPGNPFWDRVHLHHRARMVVVECKNLSCELGQTEVESISQYLYPRAMRSFGILCGRQGPSDSAMKARRRAWQESEKLIVMLSDIDLHELLRLKGADEEPTGLLDEQMDQFFIKLAP